MKGKIKYTDEPIGKVKVISDFLPPPEELALKDQTVKVTISLSKTSVDFFKKEAKKYNTQYQKMIRRLLDEYTAHQQSSDHFLILSVIFFGFFLKKIDARLAKRNCDFNGFILQSQAA